MRDKVHISLLAAPPDRRPLAEIVVGVDWSRSRQKWVHVERFISRFLDSYSETVVDPESGEVIHHCHERLSEHTNHGSAKPPLPRCLSDGSEIPFFAAPAHDA
jgi:hypothetical protein